MEARGSGGLANRMEGRGALGADDRREKITVNLIVQRECIWRCDKGRVLKVLWEWLLMV